MWNCSFLADLMPQAENEDPFLPASAVNGASSYSTKPSRIGTRVREIICRKARPEAKPWPSAKSRLAVSNETPRTSAVSQCSIHQSSAVPPHGFCGHRFEHIVMVLCRHADRTPIKKDHRALTVPARFRGIQIGTISTERRKENLYR